MDFFSTIIASAPDRQRGTSASDFLQRILAWIGSSIIVVIYSDFLPISNLIVRTIALIIINILLVLLIFIVLALLHRVGRNAFRNKGSESAFSWLLTILLGCGVFFSVYLFFEGNLGQAGVIATGTLSAAFLFKLLPVLFIWLIKPIGTGLISLIGVRLVAKTSLGRWLLHVFHVEDPIHPSKS